MATITLSSFRSEPGRAADHLALHMEATERLRAMGIAAEGRRLGNEAVYG